MPAPAGRGTSGSGFAAVGIARDSGAYFVLEDAAAWRQSKQPGPQASASGGQGDGPGPGEAHLPGPLPEAGLCSGGWRTSSQR